MKKYLVILLIFVNVVLIQAQTKKDFDKQTKLLKSSIRITDDMYETISVDTSYNRSHNLVIDYITYPKTDSLYLVMEEKEYYVRRVLKTIYTVTYINKNNCYDYVSSIDLVLKERNAKFSDLDVDTRKKYLNCKQQLKK